MMIQKISLLMSLLLMIHQPALAQKITEPQGTLVLSQALSLALTQSPKLAAFSQEIRAKEAKKLQVTLLPNPVLTFSASNLGNAAYQGFDGESLSLELSQLIELGGKRIARIKAAGLSRELAQWDYERQRINVVTEVTIAFINVLVAQESLKLAQEMSAVVTRINTTVMALFNAGQVAGIEKTKANILLSVTQIESMRAKKKLEITRIRLASLWGGLQASFNVVAGNLEMIKRLPPMKHLVEQINQNPDLARWITEINQRQALVYVEKSQAIPDVTLTLGLNDSLVVNEYAMLASVSIPLPLFNRNQGHILAAYHRLNKAKDIHRQQQFEFKSKLTILYQQLQLANDEISELADSIIPNAEHAYHVSKQGYQVGEFDLLNLLEAQRTLFTLKKQYLNSLSHYHLNVAQIERLTGMSLNSLIETQENSL